MFSGPLNPAGAMCSVLFSAVSLEDCFVVFSILSTLFMTYGYKTEP